MNISCALFALHGLWLGSRLFSSLIEVFEFVQYGCGPTAYVLVPQIPDGCARLLDGLHKAATGHLDDLFLDVGVHCGQLIVLLGNQPSP